MDAALTPQQALGPWRRHVVAAGGASGGPEAPLEQTDDGLINRTFFVGDPSTHVLQWVNPIFDRRIQLDIDAVTRHLAAAGWLTPRLVPTDDGVLDAPDGGGFWRLMTFIPGVTHHRLRGVRMASAVGELVGRFH
ncbi:MAG: phosphotransferase, partial [Acidobacteriota bacterium]